MSKGTEGHHGGVYHDEHRRQLLYGVGDVVNGGEQRGQDRHDRADAQAKDAGEGKDLAVRVLGFLDLPRAQLLLFIVQQLLGPHGITLLAIIVALACVTTAAALVSSTAAYFSDLLALSYRAALVLTCIFSAVVSAFGLERIVALASPILSILYPPTLVLILLSFFDHRIPGTRPFQLAALGSLLISCLTTAESLGLPLRIQSRLPLGALGFGWLLPAVLCCLLGFWLDRRAKHAA